MSKDRTNAFERHAVPHSLAADQQNPFQKHDAARRAARTASDSQAQREQARQTQRQKWNHQGSSPTSAAGVVMDKSVTDAKQAYDADRQARGRDASMPMAITSWRSIQALIEYWQRHADNARDFYESEFNYTSLCNAVVTLIFGRRRPATVETVAEAHAACFTGNYLELPRLVDGNGATIRKRGWSPQPVPPAVFPAYIWPAQAEAASQDELKRQMDDWLAGKKPARERPFHELQAEVRSGFKAPRPGGPNLDRS